ncbi:MAG: hypothetical protein A2X67_15255 [Ignavibacteria bacterium GWA2_55_11]|nr:MAG: hypothetical protein A2X67_15255 [Ignavibacteria bacterium GWA2_55_11]OGU44461.1 MAG: hypothetical protein A2X68_05110 [Ignavibacteria bacterium GWC2_56_12]OGU68280.1 MAG: hypothetical protein A3C56_10500 [Ignavibacteria bacterium RIFCSPHIGHO2_02_FULL_56_12]OGU72232.1 MAG: hypothetical protein A3H45_05145 [Ignavibacteria bacterium RIFCSPLOWO2_02_FULL_55_14]OGU72252.1 MAG: hypothetical protein A3G43_09565 [Ignavibacteria bacterium RIFCSPLOWO2_12_FULL_56_21]HAV22390.1 hypothetical protei
MFHRQISTVLVVLGVIVSTAVAQDDSTHAKLDTLVAGQKQIITMQEKIYAEVYSEPLSNRSAGLELNPAFLLLASANEAFGLSSGLQLFSIDRKAEIGFPIYYYKRSGDDPLTHMNIDMMYRRFLGKHQDGFYISLGLRYTHLKGKRETFLADYIGSSSNEIVTQNKVGAHFGIGYRYFSYSGFFWGASLYAGRYFSGDETGVTGVMSDDTKMIYDIELLKFGIAF